MSKSNTLGLSSSSRLSSQTRPERMLYALALWACLTGGL
ncbi:hypothetical protein MSAN_01192800 [Mycena sanguinolenta]|uniref:Uncharacterized protein n=1 Tax=Mycena sanguinolenta TaxID=230812 RepID=A0A8H7D6W3_9AGAR|nr:hypothetical protein MSAN_01192800 [Mycena sanguinolenta]